MNILIVKTSAIGDVTHTLPCLNALRLRYPDSHITWLVEEAAADVIRGHHALDRVLVSRRKQWLKQIRRGEWLATAREIREFIRQLREIEYDLIVDFQNLLKSSVFVGLARGRRKVGYGKGMEHSECSYIFLNERIPAVDMDQHAVIRELKLLQAIGIDCPETVFDFPISNGDRRQIDTLLAGLGFTGDRPLVAINPVATWPTKLWDNDKFARIADSLIQAGNFVVFTGAETDRPILEDITGRMKERAISLAGQTSLKGLAALYEKAAVVISTDTGPMHIAASVSTPVVALFGPTAPWRTGPFGEGHQVLRVEIPCSPCFKKECPSRECMGQITAGMVLRAVDNVMQQD